MTDDAIYSSLKQHEKHGIVLQTPMNKLNLVLQSWSEFRLPQYLWLGLILNKYGHSQGIKLCLKLLEKISKVTGHDYSLPKFSDILNLSLIVQKKIFDDIIKIAGQDVLSPLTLFYTYSKYSCFSTVFKTSKSVKERKDLLMSVIEKLYNPQSNETTDLKYLIVCFSAMSGNLCIANNIPIPEMMEKYQTLSHDLEEMKEIRPIVRALEGGLSSFFSEKDKGFANDFWNEFSKLCDCELMVRNISKLSHDDILDGCKEKLTYYYDLFISSNPLDEKIDTLLGISTYSYKLFKELIEHKLYNTISGKFITRTLVENYMMSKYLLKKESEDSKIWNKYVYYGIGKYKLIYKKYEELYPDLNTQINVENMKSIVNEFINEEFIDIDFGLFDSEDIRKKFALVDEKELYDQYYDYGSSYVHGLWGAIRESSMLKCVSPGHRYHCVPDIDDQQEQDDVYEDCAKIMIKQLELLKNEYNNE